MGSWVLVSKLINLRVGLLVCVSLGCALFLEEIKMIWSAATSSKPISNLGSHKVTETLPSLLEIMAGSSSLAGHLNPADIFISDPYLEKSLNDPWIHHEYVSDALLEDSRQSGSVVTISSVIANRLNHVGGPGHWYHCLQAIFPSLIEAHDKIWGEEAEKGWLQSDASLFDDIYIVFNEAESVQKLNSFTRFAVVMVVTGGRFRRVHFAHASKAVVDDHVGMIHFSNGLQVHFTADRDTQGTHDLFVTSAMGHNSQHHSLRKANQAITMKFLLPLQLMAPRRQMFWFLTHHKALYFKKAFAQTCSVPRDAPVWSEINHIEHILDGVSAEELMKLDVQYALPESLPSSLKHDHSGQPDDIEDVVTVENYDIRHDQSRLNPFRADLPLSPAQVTIYNTSTRPTTTLNLLIYQRDQTRILQNLPDVAHTLHSLLSKPSSSTPSPHLQPASWNIETLVHSATLAPCDLVHRMQNTTAFVTIHGFQSTMLLFLPDNSVLAEIHPSLAYFPNHFGQFQLSFRQRFGWYRSFLGEESIPINRLVQWAKSFLGISTDYCVGQKWCRQYAKSQDVVMSPAFVQRLASFLTSHFLVARDVNV